MVGVVLGLGSMESGACGGVWVLMGVPVGLFGVRGPTLRIEGAGFWYGRVLERYYP
jgi:hypothetical protein